ncbi:MAG: Rnase Y domain-containing protein, partial [Desulfobaccales bacterium]
MGILAQVLLAGLAIAAGFAAGFFYRKHVMDTHQESLEALGKKILDEARKEADTIKKE